MGSAEGSLVGASVSSSVGAGGSLVGDEVIFLIESVGFPVGAEGSLGEEG